MSDIQDVVYRSFENGNRERKISRLTRNWLFFLAAFLLVLVQIGGATRLTGSGLSITNWDVINGVLPPLSDGEWKEAFDLYKETYQGRTQNQSMTIGEFKTIYLWEWLHRLLGRVFFFLILVPFLVLRFMGVLPRDLTPKVLIILGLVMLQGLAGWLMVRSGLATDVKVNPTWLAIHLTLATIIFGALVAMALGQDGRPAPANAVTVHARLSARVLVGLAFAMIVLGALVAGNRAGWLFTVPQVLGAPLISPAYFTRSPWYINLVENDWMVMANHRTVAFILLAWAALHLRAIARQEDDRALRWGARLVLALVAGQVLYGIFVLFQAVIPWWLGLVHQLVAFIVLGATIWHLFEVERRPAVETPNWLPPSRKDEQRQAALSPAAALRSALMPGARRDALLRAEALIRGTSGQQRKS
jgi:cytochrome c oxidase assembly protein subunit 15